jgi:N-acetyl-anhydromuramyl-L-alanine amidase AmpD
MPVTKPTLRIKTARNHSRRHGRVRFIVMHDTVGTFPGDINFLTSRESGVSCDFYVRRNGDLFQLNSDLTGTKTFHAGVSSYQGFSNLNEQSLGIEQEHSLSAGGDWPDAQVEASAHLVAWLVQEFNLDLDTHPIVSHAQVAKPAGRKIDPRSFPWADFMNRVQRFLNGENIPGVQLVFGATGNVIPVDMRMIRNSFFAKLDALEAATGLSAPVHIAVEDGWVAVRPFFEANDFRVEWDAVNEKIEVFPQDPHDV